MLVYVNSLLGTLNARTKMPSAAAGKPSHTAGSGPGSSDSAPTGTDSTARTPPGALLTTAIVLGTDPGNTSLDAEEGLRHFEEEREKSKLSTPRSGYSRLEDA